jgi:hypothetical protein
MADTIWMAVCEIAVEPGDLPSGATKGFARITTWADSPETLREKVSTYLALYKWQLLFIETAHPVDEERSCDDETRDMITRTRVNKQAIILGRFFSYRES